MTNTHEERLSSFHNICTVGDGHQHSLQNGYFSNHLSSILESGYKEELIGSEANLKTSISWIEKSCICMDADCLITAAIDMNLVTKLGNVTETSPVLLLGEDGEYLHCLTHSSVPDVSELFIQGCTWVDAKRRTVRCENDDLDSLRFCHKESGLIVARALNKTEIMPANAAFMDPDATLITLLQSPLAKIPKIEIFGIDFSPLFNSIKDTMIVTAFDAFFNALIGDMFSIPPSNAPLSSFIRISDYFSNLRLLRSVRNYGSFVESTVNGSPLAMMIRSEHPETSPIQEVWSGISLLALAAGGFGAFFGVFYKENAFMKYMHNFSRNKLILFVEAISVLVPLAALSAEAIAYVLRWKAEYEQNNFSESMILVLATFADRFDGILPFGLGKKGTTFVLNLYVVEVSDDSSHLVWIFVMGCILSLVSFVMSVVLAPKYEMYIKGDETVEYVPGAI